MFQVEHTPGGESVVTVLLNAVGSAGGVCPHTYVNTHLEEEKMEEKCQWTKKRTPDHNVSCPYHGRSTELQGLGDS